MSKKKINNDSIKKVFKEVSDQPTMTLQEIADKMGISRQRVKQIENNALKKLKHPRLKAVWLDIADTVYQLNKPSNDGNGRKRLLSENRYFMEKESGEERYDFNQKY
jgi:transcriptional regulator with XRE-family HTH domain